MESGVNAAGNPLVVNENGAVASPVLPEDGIEVLSETSRLTLVLPLELVGNDTPGSVSACNNRGVLVHPDVSEIEVETIESILMFLPWWVLSISAHPTLVLDALQPTKVRGQVRKPRVLN